MHLTNYSVNRHSESFDNDDSCDKGSKRTIKFFNAWLAARGYCVSDLWSRITVSFVYCIRLCSNVSIRTILVPII